MIYAPVLIPTVNRYRHFRECIETLSNCTWADKTDVFVAVDYPAKEEHWDGYNKIKDFLDHCDGLGFKSLNVIYRDTNYFFTEKGNLGALIEDIVKKYDRYIITEDDNVFSPNFLVFIDKGLEAFKDDQSVFAINGYRHFYPVLFNNNTFYRQNVDFSAWGYGIWRDRYCELKRYCENNDFYTKFSYNSLKLISRNGRNRLCDYLHYSSKKGKIAMTDNALSVYMAINRMNVIMPRLSTVRNQGWDNSGVNCSASNMELTSRHINQEMSKGNTFDFIGSGYEYYDHNRNVYVKNNYVQLTFSKLIISIIKFIIKRVLTFKGKY